MATITEHDVRPALVPENATVGIPKASIIFRAMLLETSNKYLADRLPLRGYVQIVETDVHGGVQPSGALFMPDAEPGQHTSFVRAPNARFEFSTR